MKVRKIILIIVLTLLLSGCSVEYNLTVDKNSMTEEINFIYPKNAESKKTIERLLENSTSAYYDPDTNNTTYYSKKSSKKFNKLYLTYTHKYDDNKLRNSNAVNYCYYKRNVVNNDDYIIIEAEGAFRCLYDDYTQVIDSAEINIKTDLKVEDNNADEVNGNKYTWKIDKSNYKDKTIYIKINKDSVDKEFGLSQILLAILVVVCVPIGMGAIVWLIDFYTKK